MIPSQLALSSLFILDGIVHFWHIILAPQSFS